MPTYKVTLLDRPDPIPGLLGFWGEGGPLSFWGTKWLAFGWPLVGLWLAFGWPLVGLWLPLDWLLVGSSGSSGLPGLHFWSRRNIFYKLKLCMRTPFYYVEPHNPLWRTVICQIFGIKNTPPSYNDMGPCQMCSHVK